MGIQLCHAQRPVEYWNQINSNGQDIPMHARRSSDGVIILSGTSASSYFAKKSMTLTRLNDMGRPDVTTEVTLVDTSVEHIGGIFNTSVNEYLIFTAFDADSPYIRPNKLGYFLVDSGLHIIKYSFISVPIDPKAFITSINFKAGKNTGEYYGMIHVQNPSAQISEISNYTHLLILDSLLIVNTHIVDTVINIDTLQFNGADVNGGDWVKMNDSIYKIVYSGAAILNTTFRELNTKTNHIEESISNVIVLDTMPYVHYVLLNGETISSAAYTDSSYIVSGTVVQIISPKNVSDSLLETSFELGQSVIAELPLKSSVSKKYHLFEPWKFGPPNTVSVRDYYFSGLTKNSDFLYKSHIFYARVLNNHGFFSNSGGSIVKITSLDDKFIERWTVSLNSFEDNRVEAPYCIIATADSGCIVFTRKMVRTYVEPVFGNKPTFPEYDIAVYKISSGGIVTATRTLFKDDSKKRTVSVYPNPAQNQIMIEGLDQAANSILVIRDTNGNVLLNESVSSLSTIDISYLNSGMYFYVILSNDQNPVFGKILLIH